MDKLPRAWTDGQQVAAALSELLLNAAQARPHHPVELAIQVDAINDRLIFVVSDDGVGMDAHTIEHAFDPFFSAKQAGRRSGLGLAKARRLVEGLGGDIELRSTAGKGTTARLSIPLIDPPIGQHNAPPSTPHENESDETSVPGGSRAVDFQKT
jgi:signal transduction histidine kinase